MPILSPVILDSKRLLILDTMPQYISGEGRVFGASGGSLLTHSQSTTLISGPRLIAFGQNFTGESLYTLLLNCASHVAVDIVVSQYQPCEQLAPCAVITGIKSIDKQQLSDWADALKIELVLVDNAPTVSKPGLLLMDMDSTAIKIECIDEIAALAGVGEQVAAVTKRAMQGELDFAESLHHRVNALAGCDEQVLKQVIDGLPLMDGLENVVEQLQQHNWQVAIASGGFTYFTEFLKAKLNLTATFANVLEIKNGKLTGKVLGDVVDAQVKADCVAKLAADYHIDLSQTVAIGDGANDLLMLGKAQLGVAFHAKPVVQQQAKVAVNAGPLDQLLYLLLPTIDKNLVLTHGE